MRELIRRLDRADYLLILAVIGIFAILNFLHILLPIISAPAGYIYNWADYFSPYDTHMYYGRILQAKEGLLFFRNLEQHDSGFVIFNILWLALGFFARFFHLSSIAAYQIAKNILLFPAIFSLYLFCIYFLEDKRKAKIAFILGAFGSGFGGYLFSLIDLAAHPNAIIMTDFMPSGAIFWTLLYSPHYTLSFALFLLIVIFTLRALDKRNLWYGIYAGFCGLLLFQFYPLLIVTIPFIFAVYSIFLFWKDKRTALFFLKYITVFAVLGLPSVLYHILMALKDRWWGIPINFQIMAPSPPVLILTYLPFFYFAVLWLLKDRSRFNHIGFAVCWLFGNFIVLYLPIGFRGRLLRELLPAILPFTAMGFCYFMATKRAVLQKNKLLFGIIFGFLFLFSNIAVLAWRFISTPVAGSNFYIKKELPAIARWIKDNSRIDDVVLFDAAIAGEISSRAGRRIYAGHHLETFDFSRKVKEIHYFYTTGDAAWQERFLKENGIKFVVFDREWLANGAKELRTNFVERAYQNGDLIVYRTKNL